MEECFGKDFAKCCFRTTTSEIILLKELAFVKLQLQGSVLGTLLQEKCDFDGRSTEESTIEAEELWKIRPMGKSWERETWTRAWYVCFDIYKKQLQKKKKSFSLYSWCSSLLQYQFRGSSRKNYWESSWELETVVQEGSEISLCLKKKKKSWQSCRYSLSWKLE